ncbi:MAG: hypothetical protein COY80_05210 [Candidatus Pacebacteria bacterium CG_4_10_14_0_8_um_filter_42_14]|nr:MAG: hypothetical protein COY80_05210 [Candidatus Pacebacteria bacterium CG_4_10_14_0_8_um_filter_42_14]
MANIFLLLLASISAVIFWLGFRYSKNEAFYSDTLFLTPLGIYVWGDALILAPFWFFISIVFLTSELDLSLLLRFYILFLALRSAYEVIYWLLHQSTKSEYQPPIFRSVKWLKAQDIAILYQLFHTCIIVLSLGWLFL